MVRYIDIVNYVRDNHINWNTDVFDILKGYFSQYSEESIDNSVEQEITLPVGEFQEPPDGEYSVSNLLQLLST